MDEREKNNSGNRTKEMIILTLSIIVSVIVGAVGNQTINQNVQVEDKALIKIYSNNTVEAIKIADTLNLTDMEMIRIYQTHKKSGQISQEETDFVINELSENTLIKSDVYRMILDSLKR